jgi:hypothetical protein
MFSLANTYAKLKKTTIIAYDLKEDGTIVFVVEAGGKYKMTREELEKAIEELSPHAELVSRDTPFSYIDEAVDEEQPKPKRRTKK